MKPKAINLFLMDGEPTQIIKCILQNWTGIAYKIPRNMLEECKEGNLDIVKHLKQTGIYFLLGKNADTDKNTIYIGQAVIRKNGIGLLGRIIEHKKNEKERYWSDWNEVICFTTQNDSFGPTEISFLENKFTSLAREANRYDVLNGNEPNQGNITEEKECELIEYVEYAKMIIGVLGHNVFEPILQEESSDIEERDTSPDFIFKGKWNAVGKLTNEGFVVKKGSQINPTLSKSAKKFAVKAREMYSDKIDAQNCLSENILFSSASAAAGFVGGCSLSGNAVWQTKDGKSPKDI